MRRDALIARTLIVLGALASIGAVSRTPNFVVHAPTPEIANQVGIAAEHYREKLALQWLGKKFTRRWSTPCQITVRVGQYGAGGETKFTFHNGHVFGWKMIVQGSLERILDSVLPHEISHTVFACHFRRPLPRWADEGAATLAEHASERLRQQRLAEEVLGNKRRIPLRKLLTIQEYPRDMQDVFTLYAQGFSLADFLIQRGGRPRYLRFLEDAHRQGWDRAIVRNYELSNVDALERHWFAWVTAGSPSLNLSDGQLVASNDAKADPDDKDAATPNLIIRSQTPERAAVSPDVNTSRATATTHQAQSSDSSSESARREAVVRPPAGRGLHAPDPRRADGRMISASRPLPSPNRRLRRTDVPNTRPSQNNPPTAAVNELTNRDRSDFRTTVPNTRPSQNNPPTAARKKAINDGWIPLAVDDRSERSLK